MGWAGVDWGGMAAAICCALGAVARAAPDETGALGGIGVGPAGAGAGVLLPWGCILTPHIILCHKTSVVLCI